MTRELVKLLGPLVTVVYADADASVREARGVDEPDNVRERDEVKRARGADQVRDIADVVIDNNGPRTALDHALDRMVADEPGPLAAPRRITLARLDLPPHLAGYLEALLARTTAGELVSLLAVTGSGGRGKYQQGWSDLDGRLVADVERLTDPGDSRRGGCRAARSQARPDRGVRGRVQGRGADSSPAAHLALIGSGHLPVLWCIDDLRLPHPDSEADAWGEPR